MSYGYACLKIEDALELRDHEIPAKMSHPVWPIEGVSRPTLSLVQGPGD